MSGNKKTPMSKIDRFVTGMIIGGALASIFRVSKNKSGKKIFKKGKNICVKSIKKINHLFGKTLLKVLNYFNKKK